MARMRDVLSAEDRAEFDRICLGLPPAENNLVRLVEIFMAHELGQANLFNEEVRHELGRMHERLSTADEQRARLHERFDLAEEQRARLLALLEQLTTHPAPPPSPTQTGHGWIWLAIGAVFALEVFGMIASWWMVNQWMA